MTTQLLQVMELLVIILSTILLSTAMFIFWVAKGGFNKKYLYSTGLVVFVLCLSCKINIVRVDYYTLEGMSIPFFRGNNVHVLLLFYLERHCFFFVLTG